MAGMPLLLVRVVRSRACNAGPSCPSVTLRLEVSPEMVKSRAGPSCVRLAGSNQISTVRALERLTAFRIFVGGLSERMVVVFRISREPARRLTFAGWSIRRSNAGAKPERSFTTGPSVEAKSYTANKPDCTRSAAGRLRVAMPTLKIRNRWNTVVLFYFCAERARLLFVRLLNCQPLVIAADYGDAIAYYLCSRYSPIPFCFEGCGSGEKV